ncbi:GntR family transcriptional regulator [Subtercola sp. RTI3]|uniref:GntR family transcriptional regulator n=1 Tax=Subtercola sp. RTI3 TaxID=3048639 RepID=UPI002B226F07|nr:GntR family transcriptional regulator [Subtercola sp. RTI3]MEA9984602.1 GntR family transcriptional regulator [Subtercola sp. RTI3]
MRIDHSSGQPLAKQIAIQIRRQIEDNSIRVGERLPPARDLAKALDVNMHTVLRAYSRLRDDGVVEMRQGRGAWVRFRFAPETAHLTQLAIQFLNEAHALGLTRSDVIRLLDRT